MELQEFRRSLGISRSVLALLSGVAVQRLTEAERGGQPLSTIELAAVRVVLDMCLEKKFSGLEQLRARMDEGLRQPVHAGA